mmetsp:Transcript_19020/g.41151  ORF Transcript_19020/g.41151 Transcript_19020/m.41151 type:complete len:328 (-) Transcript_19020:75-1058(-)
MTTPHLIKIRRTPTASSFFTVFSLVILAILQYREEARKRHISLPCAAILVTLSAFFLFVEPIPQPQSYHYFADARGFRCRCSSGGGGSGGPPLFLPPNVRGRSIIPNFGDVVSNVVILIGGLSGLLALMMMPAPTDDADECWQLGTCLPLFFVATVAVSIGSTYYHWKPTDSTLVWDRLPMTVAFVAIFCFMLDDYLPGSTDDDSNAVTGSNTSSIGPAVLAPFVIIGVLSVLYWTYTDDLRLYAVVSIMPLLLMPILFMCYRPRHTGIAQQGIGLSFYFAAKICEEKDHEIFHWTGRRISGHSLKHVLAGLAPVSIAFMVLIREEM